MKEPSCSVGKFVSAYTLPKLLPWDCINCIKYRSATLLYEQLHNAAIGKESLGKNDHIAAESFLQKITAWSNV